MGKVAQNAKWVEPHDGGRDVRLRGREITELIEGDQPVMVDLNHQIEAWDIEIATEIEMEGGILQPDRPSS